MTRFSWMILALVVLVFLLILLQRTGRFGFGGEAAPSTEKVMVQAESSEEDCPWWFPNCKLSK